ncbi:9771_t:CDS:2 [Racocetra persica]|uniref:9771_t:CDS:1 n=1 Tax=Racocetra persica TaxID=160502 RepID=A0ACA9RBN4_9GLOM|nr:9771_t:CDS:2 [Racocetra persica]
MSVAESNASKKRKERSAITLEKKVEIIKKREENTKLSHQDLANQYHVDRSTISNILRDKDKYLQLYNTTPHAQQRVRVQKGQFHIIDEAVYKLFLEFRSQNVPVSQDILKTKALSIYERLKDGGVEFPSTFNASNGWVFGFQQRFGISSKTISGESESADKAAVESGRRRFQELLKDYHPDNILNADETGLYFRLGPDKTLASKSDAAKGFKKDKQRLTVLFCCNASGTRKFKPFVIGKSARPLCMKTTNMSKLPVHYSNNKTAWMTETKWENWLKWLDSQVNQPTILLADNCTAHSSPRLQNINGKSFEPINVKEAIYLISDAWKQVSLMTIVNCWNKTKILPLEMDLTAETSDNNDIDELEQVLEELEMSYDCIKLSAEEYINVDEELQTMDTPTEESVVRDILKEQGLGKIALEVAKKYLEQSQFATEDDIYLLRQIIKKAESYYRSSLKQTTIDKYFITQ